MRGAGGRRAEVVEDEVTVGDGVDRVGRHRAEAEVARHRDTVGEEVDAGERARSEWHGIAAAHAEVEAVDVAVELPEPRQQVVREVDGLGPLEMRVAGQSPVEVLLGSLEQYLHQPREQPLGVEGVGAHEQSHVGGHLVVARARGVELPAGGPDQLDQAALDGHVDVLVGLADLERVGVDLLAYGGEPALDRVEVVGPDDVARGQHSRVRTRELEVIRREPVVERDRRVEPLEERVLRRREAGHDGRSLRGALLVPADAVGDGRHLHRQHHAEQVEAHSPARQRIA
jgi:hypothetical protein